jgi:hypothetical protein
LYSTQPGDYAVARIDSVNSQRNCVVQTSRVLKSPMSL